MQLRTIFFGEGLFETILWRGKTKKLLRHYERLKNSADFFQIPCPDFETFCQSIEDKTKGRKNIYVKFCLFSKGDPLYYSYPKDSETLVITKECLPNRSPKKLCLSNIRRHRKNPVVYHKTINYLSSILVRREALSKGFDDGVILNEEDQITECSSSNILILKDNKLFTPAQECGLLLGTTISILIEKMNVKQERLNIADLYDASSVFITNSLIGVLPVIQFMDKSYLLDNELLFTIESIIDKENSL